MLKLWWHPAKCFNILITNSSVLHNYLTIPTKLFLNLIKIHRFLNKPFFLCRFKIMRFPRNEQRCTKQFAVANHWNPMTQSNALWTCVKRNMNGKCKFRVSAKWKTHRFSTTNFTSRNSTSVSSNPTTSAFPFDQRNLMQDLIS